MNKADLIDQNLMKQNFNKKFLTQTNNLKMKKINYLI